MKIKTVTGKVVDTDKLSDKKAEIYEAINNLYSVCEKYNTTFVARVVLDAKETLGANFTSAGKAKERKDSIMALLTLLDEFVSSSTGGVVRVKAVETE